MAESTKRYDLSDSIPDIISRRALLAPESIVFRDLTSGRALTYEALEIRSQRAAGLLSAKGIDTGDRVAVLCRNRIEFFELMFACAKLGAILVPLNWRMPAAELQALIDDARPMLLFHGIEDGNAARKLKGPAMSHIALDDERGYATLRDASKPCEGRAAWPSDECWYLLYTSGTTGQPKAVIQTYRMALANHVNISQAMGISGNDVTLNYLPLFHSAGINLVTLPTMIQGGTILMLPGFDLERIIEILAAATIDTFFAVPAVYQQISLHARFDSLDLSRIRSWGCGGAPLPDDLVRRYHDRGASVCNGMGMTETGPTVFIMDTAHVRKKIGSVGKPQLLAMVRITDGAGKDVPPGETGELWFAGPNVTPGYWNNAAATRATVTEDGWLKSGDLGKCDEDGYYFIVGRIKEMFISGGENVYPAEVENILAGHPDVLEAAVIGVRDEKWGEVGHAFVMVRPGHAKPPAEVLTAYCRQHLAAYKVPRHFEEVSEFPRTAAGKVQKHLLSVTG